MNDDVKPTLRQRFREQAREELLAAAGRVFERDGQMRAHWSTLRLLARQDAPTGRAGGDTRPHPDVIREVHALLSSLVRHGITSGVLRPVDEHVATCSRMGIIRTTIDLDLALGLDAPSEARADVIVPLFLEGTARR